MAESITITPCAIPEAATMAVPVEDPIALMYAEPMSEIERLARQWIPAWRVVFDTDEEQDRHRDEVLDPLCDRIASLPATNARDMLWKVVVDTRDGDFCVQEETHAEIRRLLRL